MASTPSSIGQVETQTKGENAGTWGQTRLNEAINRLTEMGVGARQIALTGNKTLTTTNYQQNESRWGAHIFTDGGLSAVPTITYPAETRFWLVINATTFALTLIANASAVNISIPAGKWGFVWCNGTDLAKVDLASLAGTLPLASLPTQANLTVLGNVSGASAVPAAVTIINDNTMALASSTTLATSASVKTYIDTLAAQGDLATVVSIASQIVQVAALETQILAVVANEANITAAPGAATAAAASATDASGSATAAAASATIAQQWAANPEDSVVSGGLFSALHYAAKAADSAVAAATFDPAGYEPLTAKGQPNGYAPLDGDGLVLSSDLPAADDTVLGAVQLATSGQMTIGTDPSLVPPVAVVAAYVADNITPNGITPIGVPLSLASVVAADIILPTGFPSFHIHLRNIILNSNEVLYLRTSADGGSTFDSGSADYSYFLIGGGGGPGSLATNSNGSAHIDLTPGASIGTGGPGYSGIIQVIRPELTIPTQIRVCGVFSDLNDLFYFRTGGGLRNASAGVNSIRIFPPSGNIASGEIQLYGVENG